VREHGPAKAHGDADQPSRQGSPCPGGRIDPAVAVVLGSAVTGLCIKTAAGFAPGDTVLVQGATGVAGRLAVKVARLLGAGRIVGTGRGDDALQELRALGADVVINTASRTRRSHARSPRPRARATTSFSVPAGTPTEILRRALVPEELKPARPTRLVHVGESAGPALTLAAGGLRTSGVELDGAAKGLDGATMMGAHDQVVQWARDGTLTFDLEQVPLSQIETAWQPTDLRGRRLVVLP
jgi:NADPH:quinone reductase-like Zn-dependent oxidoreductase